MIATNSSAGKVKKLQKQFKELKEDFIELEENLEEAMDKNMQEFGEDMRETMDENMQELDKNMTETMDENMHHVNHSLNHLDKRIGIKYHYRYVRISEKATKTWRNLPLSFNVTKLIILFFH